MHGLKYVLLLSFLRFLFLLGLRHLNVTDSSLGVPSGHLTAINILLLVTGRITGCVPAAITHTFGLDF